MVNKRGWIRIFEAVVAILLITGVALVVLDKSYLKKDISSEISRLEDFVLKEIKLNSTLRAEVLGTDIGGEIPQLIQDKIDSRIPDKINCSAKVCAYTGNCVLDIYEEKAIFAKSTLISATPSTYNPKQFKLFCWELTN